MLNTNDIERYVSDLLTVSGFRSDGEEQHLWLLLHHLYCAVAMYEQMGDDDKVIIADTQKKLKYFFCTKCNLKERKRTKTEKESIPPYPHANEKENKKEKDEKTNERAESDFSNSLEERREAFRQECLSFVGQYDAQQVADFFHYWAEENSKKGKMLFEIEKDKKSWNTGFRLARWNNNQFTSATTAAAIRLRKTKKKEAKETAAAEQQQNIAAIREQADIQREQAQEQSKETQMLTADYISQNPNGFLAKVARERAAREKHLNEHELHK